VIPFAGLLRAMSAQLTRPDYWQTAYHLHRSPPFLALLSLLVPRQPALHGTLLSLLGGALGALGNANHDMAKGLLSIAVQVWQQGALGFWGTHALGGWPPQSCHFPREAVACRLTGPPVLAKGWLSPITPAPSRLASLGSITLQLVSAGRVGEVLRWAEEWKARADPSLVRHLAFGVLEVAAPPYSPDFAGSMLRCEGWCAS
jgi:hypothetical protein